VRRPFGFALHQFLFTAPLSGERLPENQPNPGERRQAHDQEDLPDPKTNGLLAAWLGVELFLHLTQQYGGTRPGFANIGSFHKGEHFQGFFRAYGS
jgi:hypothetical protein